MEGLEELEKIKKFQFTYPILRIGKEKRETTTIGKIFEKELSAIEKELKDYKEIKEIMRNHNCKDRFELNCKLCDYEEMLFDSEESKKKLKALEIVKRELNIVILIKDGIKLGAIQLTQEEYDLLKEVLK